MRHQRISQEEFFSCRCSATFLVEQETMNKNVWQTLDSYLCMKEKLAQGQWSFIGPGSEKKCYSWKEYSPQGLCDNLAEKMWLEFAKSGCPIFRATTPLSRGQLKRKGHGKLSIHFAVVQETIETIFRMIVSANQLSLYGAVAEMCEEYESLHERTERPVLMGQSIVLSAIKTEISLENDDPVYQNFLFHQYKERIEKLSQQGKLSKFCMDARFLSVVENGQYFLTKDTGDLTQFNTVTCREYTLPREDSTSQPKGWIQGNIKIGPVLKVTTSYLHGKHVVETRIVSLSRDNSHSWVRISHGSNKIGDGLEQQRYRNSRRSARRTCVTTGCERFYMPIKGKSKTTKKRTFSLRVRGFEESDSSSSSLTESTSRRRWSGSFLENEVKSSESISTIYSLV